MDPVQEIKELKGKRDQLEHALAQPGIDKDERIAIHNRIAAVGAEIVKVYEVLAHGGAAGGLPMNDGQIAILVALEVRGCSSSGVKSLPRSVEAFADSGCSYPLLLSEKT